MTDSTFDLTGIGGQASLFSRPRETSISGAVPLLEELHHQYVRI